MENYIHRENLALLKKRLGEARNETERQVLIKLLAEQEAKNPAMPKRRSAEIALRDKLDIAKEMTKSGTACDWPKFSGGHYRVSENTLVRK